MSAISFLAAPFVLTILLVGIHAYLGLHVLEREVVFVDISLSQVAALGSGVGLFFSTNEKNPYSFLFSLVLCLIVSFLLALFRKYEKKISQEAIIGITYAFASAMLIIFMDRLPHGMEHIKSALVGNILFVSWKDVFQTFFVYLIIGSIHYKYRKQFWLNSNHSSNIQKSFFWDLLFYFLFAVVITFSTHHAGVLVVFSILIAPASLSLKFFKTLKKRMWFSWIFGAICTLLAFVLNFDLDLPAGAGIVATLTGSFFVSLILSLCLGKRGKCDRFANNLT